MIEKKQLTEAIAEQLREMGLRPRSYSGRNMFGRSCLGVCLDGRSAFSVGVDLAMSLKHHGKHWMAEELAALDTSEDSLGRDYILYFQQLDWTIEDERRTKNSERLGCTTDPVGDVLERL